MQDQDAKSNPSILYAFEAQDFVKDPIPFEAKFDLSQAGFRVLVAVFKFYGFDLNIKPSMVEKSTKPALNRLIIYFNLLLSFLACSVAALLWYQFVSRETSKLDLENVFFMMSFGITNIGCLYIYLNIFLNFKILHTFVWNMAETVDYITGKDKSYADTPERVKKWLALMAVFTLFTTSWSTLVTITNMDPDQTRNSTSKLFQLDEPVASLLFRGAQMFYFLWGIFSESFQIFFTFFIVFSCKLLFLVFERQLPKLNDNGFEIGRFRNVQKSDESTISMAERQFLHQKFCILVKQADEIFASFMFIWLLIEIISIICAFRTYEKLVTLSLIFSLLNGLFYLWKIGLFMVKAVSCSKVNDKITSTLKRTPAPKSIEEIHQSTGEHINYLLYLNEQITNSTTLTYGGFIPVRSTFIFTVAGTALSYGLILKDMRQDN